MQGSSTFGLSGDNAYHSPTNYRKAPPMTFLFKILTALLSLAILYLSLQPATGFVGEATISYAIKDTEGLSDAAIHTISVGAGALDGTVNGTSGDDLIDGGYLGDPDGDLVDNNDAIVGNVGSNDDIIEGYDGNDVIFSGDGNDTVFGSDGADTLLGGTGNDYLDGDDAFAAGAADSISGGSGNDTIIGDVGNDTLDGGADVVQ